MVVVDKLLYSAGINIGDLRSDIRQAEALFRDLGGEAQKVFGRQIGNELGRAIDPKKMKAPLNDIRQQLSLFGQDAVKIFDRSFGRTGAKSIFDNLRNESKRAAREAREAAKEEVELRRKTLLHIRALEENKRRDESNTFFGQMKQSLGGGFNLKTVALGAAAGFGAVELGRQLLQAGADATKFAAEFERALLQVKTIAGQDFNIGQVGDQLKNLSREIPQDLITLTKGLGDIIGSGVKETSDALKVLEVSAKAATAGATQTEVAAKGIVFVMNAFRDQNLEASHIADVLFKTVDEGVVSFEELASGIGEVAAPAALAGLKLEDVGAAIGVMTQGGIGAAETMTALKRLIGEIVSPAKEAQKAAAAMGIDLSVAGVKAAGGLKEFIAQIQQVTGGDPAKLAKIFPEERALKAAQQLAGVSAQAYQELADSMRNTGETAGAMNRAFRTVMDSSEEQWKLLKNNLSVAVVEAGGSFLDFLNPALVSFNDLLSDSTDVDKAIRSLESLGIAAKEVSFLQLIAQMEQTQKTAQQLQKDLVDLINQGTIMKKSFGGASLEILKAQFLPDLQRQQQVLGAIAREAAEIAKTEAGRNELNLKIADTQLRMAENAELLRDVKLGIAQGDAQALEKSIKADAQYISTVSEVLSLQESINKTNADAVSQREKLLALVKLQKLGITDLSTAEIKYLEYLKATHADLAKVIDDELKKRADAQKKKTQETKQETEEQKKAREEAAAALKRQREEQDRLLAQLQKQIILESEATDIGRKITQIRMEADEREKIMKGHRDGILAVGELERIEIKKTTGDYLDSVRKILAAKREIDPAEIADIRGNLNVLKNLQGVLDEETKKLVAQIEVDLQLNLDESARKKVEELNKEELKLREEELKKREEDARKEEELYKKRREALVRNLSTISGAFDGFLNELRGVGINVNDNLLMLTRGIHASFSSFLPALQEFQDILKSKGGFSLDKLASGFNLASIGASIALPIAKSIFDSFGKRPDWMKRADERIRQEQEKAAAATEKMRQEFEKFRESMRDRSLDEVNRKLAETRARIREITNGFDDLTAADLARVEELTNLVSVLEQQISDAEDRGDFDLVAVLRENLQPYLDELEEFGFRTSNFTAQQLEDLKLLVQNADDLRKALEEFGGFAESLSGIMERLEAQFELFDIEDPVEKLRLFRERIQEVFGVILPETNEGIEDFVMRAFDAFKEGGQVLIDFMSKEGFGNMNPDDFFDFLKIIERFGDGLKKETDDTGDVLDKIGDKFSDLLHRLDLEFDLFNIDDPIAQMERMREEIKDKFGGIIPTTKEGIDAFIKSGFEALKGGEDAVKALLASLDLEELTADTFEDLLRRLAGFARQAKDKIDELDPDAEENLQVGTVRQITFTEANELIAEVSTIRTVVTQMLDLARDPDSNPMTAYYSDMSDYLSEGNLIARQQLTELIQIKLAVRQLAQQPRGNNTNDSVVFFNGSSGVQAPSTNLSRQELANYRDAVSRSRGKGVI